MKHVLVIFLAINDSCLVYDGKLVVDKDFLTNDPTIRAAGSLTKFARHYHAELWYVPEMAESQCSTQSLYIEPDSPPA